MYRVRASEIPMADRLPRLRSYLTHARKTVANPSTDSRVKMRLQAQIARIEADLARAAGEEV